MKELGLDFKILRRDYGLSGDIIQHIKYDHYMNLATLDKICNTLEIDMWNLVEYSYEEGTQFKYTPNRK